MIQPFMVLHRPWRATNVASVAGHTRSHSTPQHTTQLYNQKSQSSMPASHARCDPSRAVQRRVEAVRGGLLCVRRACAERRGGCPTTISMTRCRRDRVRGLPIKKGYRFTRTGDKRTQQQPERRCTPNGTQIRKGWGGVGVRVGSKEKLSSALIACAAESAACWRRRS